jgi:hypothetical protein
MDHLDDTAKGISSEDTLYTTVVKMINQRGTHVEFLHTISGAREMHGFDAEVCAEDVQ